MKPHFDPPEKHPGNSPAHYSRSAMLFHWSIVALVLFEFVSALSFSGFNPGDGWYLRSAYRLHMSMGMLLLVLSIACVVWRLSHTYPSRPADMHAATRVLANINHLLLYLLIITIPLTGWTILSARNSPAAMVGHLKWPNIAYLSHMTHEQRVQFNDFVVPIHSMLSYCGLLLISLHVAASLCHHCWRGDDVLTRMLPEREPNINCR